MRALTLSLAMLAATPAFAADKMTLILDWFVNPDHGPIIVAEENGLFAEQGLEVEVIAPSDPADPPKLAAVGKADLAISYQPQLHLQVAEGLPLKRVGTLIGTPLNCLLVLEDGPIKEIADLKDRKVGFSVAGVEEALLKRILENVGLSLDDIELVNVNWSLSPSLMAGQVDAVVGAFRNFELNQMEIEGVGGRCFNLEDVGVPNYEELIYVANPEMMDEDKIARFLEATRLATEWIAANQEEAWEVFSGTAAELQDELNAKAWVDTVPHFTADPAALVVENYTSFETFLNEAGLVEGMRDVPDLAVELGTK